MGSHVEGVHVGYDSPASKKQDPSAYEKGVPGAPGSPLSDLKPVGLWRYPEALKRLAEAFRGSLKASEAL